MGRFSRSWQMFTASWRVLWSRRELAVFPILSGIAALLVAVLFLTPAFFTLDTGRDTGNGPHAGHLRAARRLVPARHWLRILPWAVISATVSLVLRLIEERLGFIGRWIVGLVGMAWNLVTYLVLR